MRKMLKKQISLSLVFALVVITVIYSMVLYPFERNRLDTVIKKIEISLDAIVEQRISNLGNQLFFVNIDGLKLTVQRLAELQGIISIGVFDKSGAFLVSSDGRVMSSLAREEQAKNLGRYTFKTTTFREIPVAVFTKPITAIGEHYGYIRVYYSLQDIMRDAVLNAIIFIALLLSILLALTLVINFSLSKLITRPLSALAEAMNKVKQGNLGVQVETHTDNEIGDISDIFNGMSLENAEMYRKLDELNVTLEKKILARTEELHQKNNRLNEELKKSASLAAEAARANEAKSIFLANMSHELRTPLNAILGFSQIIARGRGLSAEDQKNLEIINRSGEHLLSLINDVLDMSKIESGRLTLNKSSFNLYHMLDGINDLFKLRFEKKGLYLRFEKTPDVPQFVRTDETRLRQVLVNLLNNAEKFTDKGGVIVRVKCHDISNDSDNTINLQFEIEDTGVGIDPVNIVRIFDPFIQDDAGLTSGEGTGLGLPISRKIAGMMNGNITVDSKLGHGSLFKVIIQLDKQSLGDMRIQPVDRKIIGIQPDESGRMKQYKILIVDDIESSRQVLCKLLSPIGFKIREAANGKEAIDCWREWSEQDHPPDLIWMDVRMPILNGHEATKQIKQMAQEKRYHTVIIAVSASVFDQDIEEILSIGYDDFVSKPFQESIIFEKMHKHLGLLYVYEAVHIKHEMPIRNDDVLSEKLQSLPEDWRNAMKEAVELSDHLKMCSLVTEIRDRHSMSADLIQRKIDQFDYDEILTALQRE